MNLDESQKITLSLIETFEKAGEVSLSLRKKGLKTEIKSDNTPVTNGDIEVNILLKQKKIAEEVRLEIEDEITFLKMQNKRLENELYFKENTIIQNKKLVEETKMIKWDALYGKECKKTFYNNLHKVGTEEYRNCILSRGMINN